MAAFASALGPTHASSGPSTPRPALLLPALLLPALLLFLAG